MNASLQTLDVRPILANGGEPFGEIMQAVAKLGQGQSLRLLAPFKPVPLFEVMKKKGFSHRASALEGGDWEVIFSPEGAPVAAPSVPNASGTVPAGEWPAPSRSVNNRGLMPPEPLVITLETLAGMQEGEVFEGFYDREPQLLFPELDSRGHRYKTEKQGPGEYRVLILCGSGEGAA
ncbi:Conserved hypothetical protein [gamma proteobacterium HdN1]|nr:Conserved hypothetical protein [gamma proteobacterium HdN1]